MTHNEQSLPPLEPEARETMIHLLESLIKVLEVNQRDFAEWKAERTSFLN